MRLSIEFSLAAIMALVLYFVAGKNNTILNLILLVSLFGFCLHPVLSLPWIAAASPYTIKAWRILVAVTVVLIATARFGIWVWPTRSEPEAKVEKSPTQIPVKSDIPINPPQTVAAPPAPSPPKKDASSRAHSRFREKRDEYHVSAGSIEGKITPENPMNIIRVGDTPLVRGYIKEGQLLVDARLYAGSGFNPVEIKGNEFALRNPMWDRNFDDSALEIVNDQGIPVMQVIYTTPQNVLIYGIFQGPNQIYLITSKGMRMMALGSQITKDLYDIKKIFQYPSRKHLGQEVKEEEK